jgi:hypothetical protein
MNHILSFFHTLSKTRDKDMNAHLTLQARLHDLEESEEKQRKELEVVRAADANEERGELDECEARAEAEVEREHMLTEDIEKQTADSDGGNVSECTNDREGSPVNCPEEEEQSKRNQDSGGGGHTPGEVWTESPHFLWGP